MGKNSLSLIISLKKILFSFIFTSLFSSQILADDFLAKLTNNALSDHSQGVKKLTLDEASQVVGGYYVGFMDNRTTHRPADEIYAIGLYGDGEKNNIGKGLCGIDSRSCSNPSQRRLVDWLHVIDWSGEFLPVYTVKRQIQVSSKGNRFVVFSYGVGVIDAKLQIYKFSSGVANSFLNNNMIIKEIANKYKGIMENALGGYYIGR